MLELNYRRELYVPETKSCAIYVETGKRNVVTNRPKPIVYGGVLHPQGITKVDYIRNALDAYNQYFEEHLMPRVAVVKEEVELPLPVFIENGVDVVW